MSEVFLCIIVSLSTILVQCMLIHNMDAFGLRVTILEGPVDESRIQNIAVIVKKFIINSFLQNVFKTLGCGNRFKVSLKLNPIVGMSSELRIGQEFII